MAVAGGERAGRRRRDGGELVLISWRDIPAQVNTGSGERRVQRILPRRFQRAIDNAAMVAGMSSASQYIGEWRRATRPAGDDPEGAALRLAAELEAAFPRERLEAFVATGGWDPERAEPSEPTDEATPGPQREEEAT
ncbi:MAG: virulence factor [bacterium]|nr:virulence factor [bacterium]